MLVREDLGFPSVVFLVVVGAVAGIVFIVRREWRQLVARREEVNWLLASASEESARAEFEARETYFYTASSTPLTRVSVPVSTSGSVQVVSPIKPLYKCAVCLCPTTTRCSKCKAVRYCSGNCQIIHWRQGHKYECRPYVSASPVNNVESSPYRQADHKDQNEGFGTEIKQNAIPSGKFPENSHHKNDIGIKSPDLGTQSTSASDSPTKSPTGVTFEKFETVKPANQTLVNSARKSTALGKTNKKNTIISDVDAHSGTSTSSFWTDDGSNETSLSEPSRNSSVETIYNNKSSIDEHNDLTPGSCGEAANGYKVKVKDGSGQTGYGSKKSDDDSEPSKFTEMESRNPPPGASSHRGSAGYSTLRDVGFARSNDVLRNKNVISHISKSREVGSSLFEASDTNIKTFTNRHTSHGTKSLKVNDGDHRVPTCSSQLTENPPSVKIGSKMSKLKVVDQVKPSKLKFQEPIEGRSESTHRYAFKGLFSYETFVKLYNWKKVELQPFGLKNCGNSCYANAVLQCLIYTPPLTAYLLEGLHSKSCDKRGWCFTCELEGLVAKGKNGNSPLSPIHILTHIENIGSNLGHGREEDAHEFLRYVIDALQSVCIKEAGKNGSNSLEEETTIIGLTFGGYLRSKIVCMKCGGKSELHERMMDLTVEIEGDVRTLEGALDKFTSTEILDGENKYKCSRCKSYEKAKKKLTLLEAPNVLTIALKRFQSGIFGKLNKSVSFPDVLDMAPYVSGTSDKSPIYQLYGVVVHIDTMNDTASGHYVCYAKNFQNRWFKFDDSIVREVELQHVLTKGAYMLLYARCSPRAPRPIRSSLIHHHHHDPRKHKTPPSFEPWDARNYHPNSNQHRSLEDESSSSSSDNSGFFSESCSCSTESSHRDSTGIEEHVSENWEHDYWRNMNVNSSDSDTSSTSSFPSPLYSRLSKLYIPRTNGGSRVQDHCKECRKLDCSCSSCRVTNSDRLGRQANNPGLTSGRLTNRGKLN